jgi:hypothetical protein
MKKVPSISGYAAFEGTFFINKVPSISGYAAYLELIDDFGNLKIN